MKKYLAENRYHIDYDVISAVKDFFEGLEENFYATEFPSTASQMEEVLGPQRRLC